MRCGAGFCTQVYCHARGFMAAFHAGFDHSRAARQVLRDYVDGKLLYCHSPPTHKHLSQFTFPVDADSEAVLALQSSSSSSLSLAPAAPSGKGVGEGASVSAPSVLLSSTGAAVADAVAPRVKPVNVMDIVDTDGMFELPLPKHKSKTTAVMTSHRRRRKGERDPDPYRCHTVVDPMEGLLPAPVPLARVKVHGAKGEMQEDTAFVRVQRPYAAPKAPAAAART